VTNKIFQDPTSQVPRSDPQFVRVGFDGSAIGGRADFIPKGKVGEANIAHVATKTGGK
jgi:hypothetical protein